MASVFSDHFVGSGSSAALPLTSQMAAAGIGHSRLRHKIARLTVPIGFDAADNDRMVFCTMKSGDRIGHLYTAVDSGGFGGTATVNIGVQESGAEHDGAIVIEDLFEASEAISAAVPRTDKFGVNPAMDVNDDRWKTLWALVNLNTPATYAADPLEDWDIVWQFNSNPTAVITAPVIMTTEVWYVSGD